MFTKKELYCANCGKKIDLKFGLPDSCTNCKIRFEFPKITQKHGITGFLLLFTLSGSDLGIDRTNPPDDECISCNQHRSNDPCTLRRDCLVQDSSDTSESVRLLCLPKY